MSNSLSILYFGPISGTCLDRANALRRLGHSVEHMDLRLLLPKTQWVDRITWHLGGNLLAPLLMRRLGNKLNGQHFDLCYVDGGEWVTSGVISLIRKYAAKVINYNIDDPLGPRDGQRFKAYRQSLPNYYLNVVVRNENIAEAYSLRANYVVRVYRSADEISHAPRQLNLKDHKTWDSDVLFLGTWFPERGPFLLDLILRGVPLTIRGSNWHKAPEWPKLKNHWKGGSIVGDDYAKAIQCAKVNLGLLSKENRDLHTTRSLERSIAKTEKSIIDEREKIKLLNAEWASLTRPDRLQKLAEEQLHFKTVEAQQFVPRAQIGGRVPQTPPVKLEAQNADEIGKMLESLQ